MIRILNIFIIVLISISILNATKITVPTDQATIQAAIDSSVNGDTVLVLPGTYVENINFVGKRIVVGSQFIITGNSLFISNTIIDGNNTGSVVTFHNSEDSNAVLSGFTITNGNNIFGAGILCWEASPTLSDLCIHNNITTGDGGGIFCYINASPTMKNLIIMKNDSELGGGISCSQNSNPVLSNCKIKDNRANFAGGGIGLFLSSPELKNVNVIGNFALEGGGIYAEHTSNPFFNEVNRCNIYLNFAETRGNDLYFNTLSAISVYVDTFTVSNPVEYHVYPINNATLHISHSKIEQVNADLYVSPAGNDYNNGLSPAEPLQTIAVALSKILADEMNPHTIYLANGEYSPMLTGEYFPVNMRSYVSLYGESKNDVQLNAQGTASVISFHEDDQIALSNLTITGGYSNSSGGGIECLYSCPDLEDLIICNNSAYDGGGISITTADANPRLINIVVKENLAESTGGGVFCLYSTNTQFDSVSIINNAAQVGGGLYCRYSSPILFKSTIYENEASIKGGGIYNEGHSPLLINVTISENISDSGGGIYSTISDVDIVNSVLWQNTSDEISGNAVAFHSDIKGGWTGIGNINDDPMFVDPANGDYRLQLDSPCIDKGLQDTTLIYNNDQDTLIVPVLDFWGEAPDMGAFEFKQETAIQGITDIPTGYCLSQNYPNPFNPSTTILYTVGPIRKSTLHVDLSIYNIFGQKVVILVNEKQEAGTHRVEWDASDFSSGVYFYRIQAGDFVQTKRMLLIK